MGNLAAERYCDEGATIETSRACRGRISSTGSIINGNVVLFFGRDMGINRIGGHALIVLKFKLAVFLFCFNPSRSNKRFALCRSIERQ